MEYAQPTPVGEEVVMPESASQAWELYPRDSLVPLGDFAQEAGFECPVLMTAEAIRVMTRDTFGGGPKLFRQELIRRLRQVRTASRQFTPVDAFIVHVQYQDFDIEELLVRQNFDTSEPYLLITERV